jgi:light-regulated signal transduction histidine kinase (bacteriophytochrome)
MENPDGMDSVRHHPAEAGWLREPDAAREFLTVAVHDLREPLRAIRASSELLVAMHEDSADERAARCMQFISDGVDRMELLIRDIAEFCYGELRELDLTDTDLQRVIAEVQRQLSGELEKNEAVLTHDPLPAVTGDFSGLATVFRCLIENACKFRGQATPRIHMGAKQQGSEWVFSIRDNGMGFDPRYQDLIFNPFERLNGRQYAGSGLGLTLAKRILQQHGGRIWAESQPGQGSTFWLTLPVSE